MRAAASVTPPDDARRLRAIETPEGIVLNFQLASVGERLAAVLVDLTLIAGVSLLLAVLAGLAGGPLVGWLNAVLMFVIFLLRHFYFVWFELHHQGRTPGKRSARLRVIDAGGGPLTAEAVFVRNATRELELFLPLLLLSVPALLGAGGGEWIRLLSFAWLAIIGLMPLLNKDGKRVGDLLAGTVVVHDPRPQLVSDLGAAGTRKRAARAAGSVPDLAFTREQLDMYGIRELQVLADLLRQEGHIADRDRERVCEKIKHKIAWDRDRWQVDPEQFLRAFYPALRAHLETKMLFGKRQEQKKRGRLRRP